MDQRGTTLVEIVIVAAIVAMLAALAAGISQGARATAARSAAVDFDALIAYAQTIAATSGNGATAVFAPRVDVQGAPMRGFTLTIYAGRPTANGALRRAPIAPLISAADVTENALGPPPFTVFFDGSAHAGAARGDLSAGAPLSSDPGCPPGERAVGLAFGDALARVSRSLPCSAVAAGPPEPPGSPGS